MIFSLIETCKANGVEPYAYLKYALENIRTKEDLSQLLSFNFKPSLDKAPAATAN